MLNYIERTFKEIKAGNRIALQVKDRSLYLAEDGTVKEILTARLFKVLGINENPSSGTFTAELIEIGFTNKNEVQPLIFYPETQVFEVFEEETKEVSEKEDNRKTIKG